MTQPKVGQSTGQPDAEQVLYFYQSTDWKPVSPDASHDLAQKDLDPLLLSSLQMQHLVVLAGSGTSLGPVGGPSMGRLWGDCECSKNRKILDKVAFDPGKQGENIESLLSKCDAYLQFNAEAADVKAFVDLAKRKILEACRDFLKGELGEKLKAHEDFLHRLSRRRTRDSRLKLFTTNYDLCFETAAARLGLVVIDGFSFSQPRYFDPRYFMYDIVRKTPVGPEHGTPLEGVLHLLKLHGSVNWRRENGMIRGDESVDAADACIIYPAKGKYQQSYIQPHLELMAQFLASLREPNTCLVVIGFGFNDDHLSEPILTAVGTNPHLRLIVVSPSAKEKGELQGNEVNTYWPKLYELAKAGRDVMLFNGNFAQFVGAIPDLKSLAPAEQLALNIAKLARGGRDAE